MISNVATKYQMASCTRYLIRGCGHRLVAFICCQQCYLWVSGGVNASERPRMVMI